MPTPKPSSHATTKNANQNHVPSPANSERANATEATDLVPDHQIAVGNGHSPAQIQRWVNQLQKASNSTKSSFFRTIQRTYGNKFAATVVSAYQKSFTPPVAKAATPNLASSVSRTTITQPHPTPSWGKSAAPSRGAQTGQPNLWARPMQSATTLERAPGWGQVQRELDEQTKKDYADFVGSNYEWPSFTTGRNGKFDVNYQPASNLMDITVKVKFEFPDIGGNGVAEKKVMAQYKAKYIQQVQDAWTKRYSFKNVREPQEAWSKLTPTTVNVTVQEVEADQHFLIQAYLKKEETADDVANVSGDNKGAFNTTVLYKGDDTAQAAFNPVTEQGQLARVQRINPSPILFDNNSAVIKPDYLSKLEFLATYLKRINNPPFEIELVGHANKTGTGAYNQGLSVKRAQAVQDVLKNAGLTNHKLTLRGVGLTGANKGAEWRKVEINTAIQAGWQNTFSTQPHEFGHMIGLGDEYRGKAGQTARHYDLVVKAFGKEYADQVAKRGDVADASIMHFGDDVRVQHYVTFWQALCETTSQKAKAPTKKFGYDDWKFIG